MTFKLTKKGRIDVLVSIKAVLDNANRNNYDVTVMNSINIEMARTGIIAAEEKHPPIIIQFGSGRMKNHARMGEMVPVAKELVERVHTLVAVNLNHGTDFYIITDYINAGFTNVMPDGSSLPYGENVKRTVTISVLTHGMGCSAEGELGHVGQAVDANGTDLDLYTNPDQALDFVERTGVDVLAVTINMAHGAYPKGKTPKLDSGRFHQLRETLKIPLVLHGGPGSDEENLRKAVTGGIDKTSVCTDASGAGKAATLKPLEGNPGADYLHMYMTAEVGIKKSIKDYMKVTGSNGRYIYDEEVAAGDEQEVDKSDSHTDRSDCRLRQEQDEDLKDDRNALHYSKIPEYPLDRQTYPITQLAEHVRSSKKTVRTKISQLNARLGEGNAGCVRKKQGTGIQLEIAQEQKSVVSAMLDSERMDVVADLDVRNNQLAGKLLKLNPGELTTISQIAGSLYLNPPTVANLMKPLQPWFEKRSLYVSATRNRGVCLVGDEYNYRFAIKDYLLYVMPEAVEALFGNFAAGIDIYRIQRIIASAENVWRIELADTSFDMVWILACLSLTGYHPEQEHRFRESQEKSTQYYVEYPFAEPIHRCISREFQVELPGSDIVLMMILLISAKWMDTILDINGEDYMKQHDENFRNFVCKVIETIGSMLDAGLVQDVILFDSPLIHMRSAIFRMKYFTTVMLKSITKYVKSEYKQTSLAIWSTNYPLEEQYGIQVTEDELAGIVLYIQAALIRQKRERPLSTVLVSQKGQISNQLETEMVRYSLPEITEIKAVSNHDFSARWFPNVGLIISTANLPPVDIRIVNVGGRITERALEVIWEKIREIQAVRHRQKFCFSNICHQLFDVGLISVRSGAEDKTQLIAMMVEKMEERGGVAEYYPVSVLERENAATISIGRGIIIPHGSIAEDNEARVVVAILAGPVD